MKFAKSSVAAAVLATLGLAAPVAQAALSLKLTDGVTTVTVADGAVGDSNPLLGAVTYVGPVGAWLLNVTTGVSKPILGSVTEPHLDLNSVNALGTGTLSLFVTDTGFIGPVGPTFSYAAVGGTMAPGGSTTFKAYVDMTDTAFGTGTQVANMAFGPSGAFSGTDTSPVSITATPFSVTLAAAITHTTAGVTSFDYEVRIPEPGTLALLGAGLIGAGIAARRKKKAA